MKTLYESILRPDFDVDKYIEVESILKKHHWWFKKCEWVENNTLRVIFDGRGYMPDLLEVSEELKTKSFDIYPWAIIEDVPELDGFNIKAQTRLDIHCSKIKNCVLTAGHAVGIKLKTNGTLEFVRNVVKSFEMSMVNINRGIFVGNDLDTINRVKLAHIGPVINKKILSWNVVVDDKDKGWSTWPKPKGPIDLNLNPIKSLGLDKHFKYLDTVQIAKGTSGIDNYIKITCDDWSKQNKCEWAVLSAVNLNNKWQISVINDARIV